MRLLELHRELIDEVGSVRINCLRLAAKAERKLKRWYKTTGFRDPGPHSVAKRYL